MPQLTFQDVSQQFPDGTVNRVSGIRLADGTMLDGIFEFGTVFRRFPDGSVREVLYLEVAEFAKDVRSERVVIQQVPAPAPAPAETASSPETPAPATADPPAQASP